MLAAEVVHRLSSRGETLAFCESLTAGLASATVAQVSGASAVLRGGLITYATDLKVALAHVPQELIDEHGVVSPETAVAMAKGTRKGVVLATGGFPNDVQLRRELFPKTPTGQEHHTLAPETTTGDGLRMAREVGAHFVDDNNSAAAWCPVSLVPYFNGKTGVFPHIM